MRTIAIIGKNYGDEGKGLLTSALSSFYHRSLIIKTNGGAQAGHTVESAEKNTRFIHHQTGSGSEHGEDTLLSGTFHPDLFQLGKEISEFRERFGFLPKIFAEKNAYVTTIDDVLINMALETHRGSSRHGSCGMGINECFERCKSGFGVSLGEIAKFTAKEYFQRLKKIREEYTKKRLEELKLQGEGQYTEMLENDNVLLNFAEESIENLRLIELTDADEKFLKSYDALIFENGQGLLLDCDCLKNAPHLTSSKTGVSEPLSFLKKRRMKLDEAVYVTRTYITKHGAGPLENEFRREKHSAIEPDMTNEPNEWQGVIRYAYHKDTADFSEAIKDDLKEAGIKPSLALTHLNETDGNILFKDGSVEATAFIEAVKEEFENIYLSDNREGIVKA